MGVDSNALENLPEPQSRLSMPQSRLSMPQSRLPNPSISPKKVYTLGWGTRSHLHQAARDCLVGLVSRRRSP